MDAEDIEALGVRHVQARLTEKEFAAVKSKAGGGRGDLQKFARGAILAAISESSEKAPYPYVRENRKLHNKIEDILNSKDQKAVGFLAQTVELCHERLRPAPKKKRAFS